MKEFKKIDDLGNITIFRLGENAKDNHTLIDDADKNDWWFHLDGESSGHCIVEKELIDKEDIIYASSLVKEKSKLKNESKVRICYTQVKNLKKTKNPGEVILLKNPEKFVLK